MHVVIVGSGVGGPETAYALVGAPVKLIVLGESMRTCGVRYATVVAL